MSRLNSNFDIISHDPHPNALAGLVEVLDLASPTSPAANGTPTLGVVGPGTIVVMDANGAAIVADNADSSTDAPTLMFTVIDGDVDFDGAFTGKVTCLQGGGDLQVENYVVADVANFVPGARRSALRRVTGVLLPPESKSTALSVLADSTPR